MQLCKMTPQDLIEPSWLDQYEQNIDILWRQLVRLNSSIFVLEKMLAFPFDLFLPPPRHFWNLVENALFETCVLIIWKVAVDTGKDGLSLQQLKNKISKHLCENNRRELRSAYKNNGFEETLSEIRPKIKEIRHKYIAHFNLNSHTNPDPEQIEYRTLLLPELKRYCDELNSIFNFLCFSHKKSLLPWGYDPVDSLADCNGGSDIERLLDNLVRNSALLNMPDSQPKLWVTCRTNLSKQELETLNKYRVKFGLSEVQ